MRNPSVVGLRKSDYSLIRDSAVQSAKCGGIQREEATAPARKYYIRDQPSWPIPGCSCQIHQADRQANQNPIRAGADSSKQGNARARQKMHGNGSSNADIAAMKA